MRPTVAVGESVAAPSVVLASVGRQGRLAVAALLLLVVLAGIGAPSVGVDASAGPWHHAVVPLAAVTEAALAVLLIALVATRRRRPSAGHPARYLRQILFRAIATAMVAVAGLALVSELRFQPTARPQPQQVVPSRAAPRASPSPRPISPHARSGPDLTYLLYGLLALVLLAAIVACLLVLWRQVPARRSDEFDGGEAQDDAQSLDQAVESGRAALADVDDARRAIIACYVAMEASLADAGAARAAAETPDELLARAVNSGLVSGGAAGRLTALFYEARFSSHPLPPGARTDAREALDAIATELRTLSGSHLAEASP